MLRTWEKSTMADAKRKRFAAVNWDGSAKIDPATGRRIKFELADDGRLSPVVKGGYGRRGGRGVPRVQVPAATNGGGVLSAGPQGGYDAPGGAPAMVSAEIPAYAGVGPGRLIEVSQGGVAAAVEPEPTPGAIAGYAV